MDANGDGVPKVNSPSGPQPAIGRLTFPQAGPTRLQKLRELVCEEWFDSIITAIILLFLIALTIGFVTGWIKYPFPPLYT